MSKTRWCRIVTVLGALAAGGLLLAPSASASGASGGPGRHSVSLNRAGYTVTGGSVKQVSASWRQPSATCAASPTYANFRISVARHGRPLQIGTATDCHGGNASFYAWTNESGQRQRFDEPVAAGDAIRVAIEAVKGGLSLEIEDDTQGWGEGSAGGGGQPLRFTRADIVVQARTSSAGVLPLSSFDRVDFTDCMVNSVPMGTLHTHEIVMQTPRGDRALPTPLGHDSFSVIKPPR